MTTHLYYKAAIHHAWWVKPLLALLTFNASIGIRCDPNRVGSFIVRHGVRVTLVPDES